MRSVRGWACALLAGAVCGCLSARRDAAASAQIECRAGRVAAVTSGAGNDTEAAWSPDGRRIAFQTDAAGDLDLAVVDMASGRLEPLAAGRGHACYPAWTPDGRVVYSFGEHPETAAQAAEAGKSEGFNLRVWEGSSHRALTRGYCRDYAPCVSPDGASVVFTSTRGCAENSASLWQIALTGKAEPKPLLALDGGSVGAVQPAFSPDGRFVVWSQLDGFRQNWRLCAARAGALEEAVLLTPSEMSAYAPRWSPDGRLIAFTGFRAGDPAWGVYLLEPRSGVMTRLPLGEGNSRSPAWSPDSRQLAFENNRTGFYKIYRVPVSVRIMGRLAPAERSAPEKTRVEVRLEREEGGPVLVSASGGRVRDSGASALRFEKPTGVDFGRGAFYVSVTFVMERLAADTRIVAVGRYAEHPLGWQVFVRESGRVCFSSRTPEGQYVAVESDEPVQAGRHVAVTGVRDADGTLRLRVDGVMQRRRASGATLCYGPALSICLGQQWNGGMRLEGRVEAFECGRGTPLGVPRVRVREQLFGEVTP